MLGCLYYNNKDCESAIDSFTTAIKLNKEYVDAYIERGNAYYYLREYKKALFDYNKAIELDDKCASAYIGRGNLYMTQRDFKLALGDFNEAVRLDNKREDAYVNRGNGYYSSKKYEKAEMDYNKAIKLNDKYSAAYTGLGNIYANKNKNKNKNERQLAEKNYREAIKNDNEYAEAHAGLGYLYYKDKDYDRALDHYKTAIDKNINLASAYNDLGTIYYIKKKYDNALDNYLKAIELDDKFADAYYQCGIINYENESYKDALDDYKKARKLYKDEDSSFNVSLLDKKIEEINGMLKEPILANLKIKQLMDKTDDKKIKTSIKNAKASFKEFITEKSRTTITVPEFLILRRWNSYTPIIADKDISKGGGYFFKIHDYGIVIDPGFNFLDNFKSTGYQFQDIDHILITHAHNDHTTDLESILTLLHEYNDAILGDIDTHEEGTIMHDVFSDISNQGQNIKYEDKDYIEETAKKEFKQSERRKRIRLYMTASTFKKYAPMLKLYETSDYDVVLIKAGDKIPILPPGSKQPRYPKDLRITAIKAKHNDLMSDRDSLGLIIHHKDFVLVYTGDTGYSQEIEKQYRRIYKEYGKYDIVLLAHLGGFREYEKKFAASKRVQNNGNAFYKNHLGRLGLAKLVEVLRPRLCIISEFGEEFRNIRVELSKIYEDTYKEDRIIFIPADIGLCINTENKIRLIDKYEYDDKKPRISAGFYPYTDTDTDKNKDENKERIDLYEHKQSATVLYHNRTKAVDIIGLMTFLVENKEFGIAEDLYRYISGSGEN